jgi:4-hydroxy-2-oxoglutarate aldolase
MKSAQEKRHMRLNGIFAALTTPFDATGAVAADRLRENVARYNRAPLAGYVVVGSTGESVLLTRAEVEQVFSAVRDAAGSGRILIAGTGSESTPETISRSKAAADLGYDGVLVKTPSFYKSALTPDALVEHYQRVADASKLPVVLYSIPQLTGVALEADVVARLAEHANIIGIKESSGNVQRVGEIIAAVPDGFQVVVGSADTLYSSLLLGAVGGVLALADCLPELCIELHRAVAADQAAKSRDLNRRILPASKKIVRQLGIAGVKCAMDYRGYYGGPVRGPLRELSAAQKREVQVVVDSLVATAAAD